MPEQVMWIHTSAATPSNGRTGRDREPRGRAMVQVFANDGTHRGYRRWVNIVEEGSRAISYGGYDPRVSRR